MLDIIVRIKLVFTFLMIILFSINVFSADTLFISGKVKKEVVVKLVKSKTNSAKITLVSDFSHDEY